MPLKLDLARPKWPNKLGSICLAVLLLALVKENLLREQKRSLKVKLKWQRSKSGSENSILGTAAWSGSGVIEKSDKNLVSTLWCEVCRKYKDKIQGMRN